MKKAGWILILTILFSGCNLIQKPTTKDCSDTQKRCADGSLVARDPVTCEYPACKNLLPQPTVDKAIVTLPGTIRKNEDENSLDLFDFVLVFEEPLLDKSSSRGTGVNYEEKITIEKTSGKGLDKWLNKKVRLTGFVMWGYAETKMFKVTEVQSDGQN